MRDPCRWEFRAWMVKLVGPGDDAMFVGDLEHRYEQAVHLANFKNREHRVDGRFVAVPVRVTVEEVRP